MAELGTRVVHLGSYLGGIASAIAIFVGFAGVWRWHKGRLKPRVAVERDVMLDSRKPPVDRYPEWGGSRLKKYYLLEIRNVSNKPFRFLKAQLIVPERKDPDWLQKSGREVILEPNEATYFLLEMDRIGDLRGARLTVYGPGSEHRYRLKPQALVDNSG